MNERHAMEFSAFDYKKSHCEPTNSGTRKSGIEVYILVESPDPLGKTITDLMSYLITNIMLHSSQFAYCNKKISNEHAVIAMIKEWRKKDLKSSVVNTVDHIRLKMTAYDVI